MSLLSPRLSVRNTQPSRPVLRCILFEDDDLLVVNKPASLNTHAPSPFAGEGIYDWLRHREPRWASLAIVHRLDKETSGVMVFAKTPRANASLTQQFTARTVRKKYLLLTDHPLAQTSITVRSALVRAGERYVSRPCRVGGDAAETKFKSAGSVTLADQRVRDGDGAAQGSRFSAIQAEPLTGKTHQIRVHAAHAGFPILGDTLYGGSPASRVHLHAAELAFRHPASGEKLVFQTPAEFEANARLELRSAVIDPKVTNACRLIHGASDGWPGWYVDRLGNYLLSQSELALQPWQAQELTRLESMLSLRGAYHRLLRRHLRHTHSSDLSPELVSGSPAPDRFTIRENNLSFEISFNEGYSTGLFLDQRDNRRRLLMQHIAAAFPALQEGTRFSGPPHDGGATSTSERQMTGHPRLLNTFAYTCGFSVCAARAGMQTTSLDLSRKYLDWGKRNFVLNQLDPADHEFLFGDVFDWLRRFARKQQSFEIVVLDPPTFSQSRESGMFRAERDYGKLVREAVPLVVPGGVLFASTNAADWKAEAFVADVEEAVAKSRRKALEKHYVPQPLDFPISRGEPAYLKAVWLRIE